MIGIKEIADKIRSNQYTLRTWLDGYRFAKYRDYTGYYEVNTDFVSELIEFLLLKRGKVGNKIRNFDEIMERLYKWNNELT